MNIPSKSVLLTIFTLVIATSLYAQEDKEGEESEGKNEVSVFFGGTTQLQDESNSAFTLGLDYQRRISKLIGIGFLFDHAMGDINSTLIGPFVAFHLGKLSLVAAPALEFSGSETNPTFRLGVAYEIKLPNEFAISPTLNYDNERREEVSIVYGISLAKTF